MVTSLYVPARLLDMVAVTAPQQNLSSLERLVLEAIHHGCIYSADLADLLGLGERMVLDLLSDMWQQGYVGIDFSSGKLEVVEAVAAGIAAGWSDQLKTTQTTEIKLRIVQELLSGHVMALKPRPRLVTPRSVVPSEPGTAPPPIRRDELLALVDELLQSTTRSERRAEVLAVNVLEEHVQTADTLIEIEVEGFRSIQAEALVLKVTGPTTIPRALRQDIERALKTLASAAPEHICFTQFEATAQAEQPNIGHYSPTLLFKRLADGIGSLGRRERLNLPVLHTDLEAASDALHERVRQASRSQVVVRALSTADEQHAAIAAMIGATRRQLVIASPRLHYAALKTLAPALRDAMTRGARIFLLWGSDPDERFVDLPPDIRHWILDLIDDVSAGAGPGERILPLFNIAQTSCRIGGGFVVQDFRHVLIGAHPPLVVGSSGQPIAAVVLDGITDSGNPWLLDILAWSRKTFPDPVKGRLITLAQSHGRDSLPIPRAPAVLASWSAATPNGSAQERLWTISWQQHAAALAALWTGGDWSAELVIDADHRTALIAALQRQGRFLVIFSRDIRQEVVSRAFLHAIEESLRAGTRVLIAVGQDNSVDSAEPLRDLATRFSGQVLLQQSSVDGELVAYDDGVLVTSFPLLRRRAFFDVTRGRREPSSIGVLLRHPRLLTAAREFLEGWGVPASFWPDVAAHDAASSTAASPVPIVPVAHVEALASIINSDAPLRRRAPQLREWFASHPAVERWAALELLEEIGIPPESMELPITCCLATEDTAVGDSQRLKWLRRLVRVLWNRGGFLEALLVAGNDGVSQSDTDENAVPGYLLRLAALRCEIWLLPELIDSSLAVTKREREQFALAIIAIEALIVDGFSDAAECLDLLGQLAGPSAKLSRAALEYWNASGERLAIAEIAAALQSRSRQSIADSAYQRVEAALQNLDGVNFSFEPAEVAWDVVVNGKNTCGDLVAAIRQKKSSAAKTWLDAHVLTPVRIEAMLDEAAHSVMDQRRFYGDYRLVFLGKKRNFCVQRLLETTRLAQRWVDVSAATALNDSHPTEAEARLLPVLRAELVAFETMPEASLATPLVNALRERVAPLFPGDV